MIRTPGASACLSQSFSRSVGRLVGRSGRGVSRYGGPALADQIVYSHATCDACSHPHGRGDWGASNTCDTCSHIHRSREMDKGGESACKAPRFALRGEGERGAGLRKSLPTRPFTTRATPRRSDARRTVAGRRWESITIDEKHTPTTGLRRPA